MKKIKVLHITPHLGGGVGRALSDHSVYRKISNSDFEESFVCLEKAEKTVFIDKMVSNGVPVFVEPSKDKIQSLVESSDIVQIEWWHHPLMDKWLVDNQIRARLSIWSHTSGLHYPAIPEELIALPHLFMFTSSVSKPSREFQNIVGVANSVGNIDIIPKVKKPIGNELKNLYIGSLNFSKLHPNIENILDIDGLSVDFYGDPKENPSLKPSEHINICGFTHDPYGVFSKYDTFIYLLNEEHYGTTENALLEAMIFGCIPIVMNNPVEASIVRDGITGYVISDKTDLEKRLYELSSNPELRSRMSLNASIDIRCRFSFVNAIKKIDSFYKSILREEKRVFDFSSIFGTGPSDIFKSCAGKYLGLFGEGKKEERLCHRFLYEKNKSSAFHFHSYFKDDLELNRIVKMLEEDLVNS